MNDPAPSPQDREMIELVHSELTTPRRWAWRGLLGVALLLTSGILSLWLTEPRPLPARLQVAFAAMTIIGVGWVGVASRALFRTSCKTVPDRIVTGWMATLACGLSLLVSTPIAALRGGFLALLALAAINLFLLAVAVLLLRAAYRHRARLLARVSGFHKNRAKLLLLIGLGLMVLDSSLATGQTRLHLEPSEIRTRGGERITIERGNLEVPSRHADPDAAKIRIAFVRAAAPENSQGPPVFVLAGGPGDSGIRIVEGMLANGGQRLRQMLGGDLIGIDQRGVAASQPNLEVADRYHFALHEAADRETWSRQINAVCQQVATRLRNEGLTLEDFNTRESAADVNAIRRALGYDRINLWGTSYGSHLGLAVMKYHGQAVDRAMFHSPEGPDHTWKRPSLVDSCLVRIAGGDESILQLIERLLRKLEEEPVRQVIVDRTTGKKTTVTIGVFDIQLLIWSALARIETTRTLPAGLKAMEQGDFRFPARWLLQYRKTAGVDSAMKHLMDRASGVSEARRKRIESETLQSVLGPVVNFQLQAAESAWGIPSLDDTFREPVSSDRPVLILCGDLDARTPLPNAREILRTLPHGRLVIISGGGHGFVPSPAVLRVIGEFFGGVDLPKEQRIDAAGR